MFELLLAILIEKLLEALANKLIDWLQRDRTLRLRLQRQYRALLAWLSRRLGA